MAYLKEDGFSVGSIQQQNDALKEMVDQIRRKLLGAEIMAGLKKLRLPVFGHAAKAKKAALYLDTAIATVCKGSRGVCLHSRLVFNY